MSPNATPSATWPHAVLSASSSETPSPSITPSSGAWCRTARLPACCCASVATGRGDLVPGRAERGDGPYAARRSEDAESIGTVYANPPMCSQNSGGAGTWAGFLELASGVEASVDGHIADPRRSPGASRKRGRSSLRPVLRTYPYRAVEVKAIRSIGCVRARWRYVGDDAFRVGSTTTVGFQPSACRPGPSHHPTCLARGDRFTMPPTYWQPVNKRCGEGKDAHLCAQDHPEGMRR